MANRKLRGTGDKMSAVAGMIDDARSRAVFLLNQQSRGLGDKVNRCAYAAEETYGVPASILLRLWNRDVTDMLLSNWAAVMMAGAAAGYDKFANRVEQAADRQQELAEAEGLDTTNSRLFAAGAVLGRSKNGAEAPLARRGRG
jgi:uncharacterized protein YjgD (DUF1641 family)